MLASTAGHRAKRAQGQFVVWGYPGSMPKVTVYLPDELYRAAQARKLSLSALTQQAVRHALQSSERQDWVVRVRSRPMRCDSVIDTALLLTQVREELGE